MDLRFAFTEAFAGLRRHASMTVAVIACVAVSLTLVGASWLLSRQVDDLKGYWYDRVEVSVFLCAEASSDAPCPDGAVTADQRDDVAAVLDALPEVEQVFYESRDDAWVRFTKRYEGSPVLEQVDATSMPEAFRVKLHDPTKFEVVAAKIAPMSGVDSVQDQRKLLAQFFAVVAGLQAAAVAVAFAQVGIALLLIGNTVRAAVASRQREVTVMRLVGASRAMVRAPFIVEAALAGLAGAVLACGLLSVVWGSLVADLVAASTPHGGSVTWTDVLATTPALLAAGVAMPTLASFISLRKHLKV